MVQLSTDQHTTLALAKYSAAAKSLVAGAQELADERRHEQVDPLHWMVRSIDRDRCVADVFRRAGVDPVEALAAGETALRKLPQSTGDMAYLSQQFLGFLAKAEADSQRDGSAEVGVGNLLNALSLQIGGAVGEVLGNFGLQPGCFRPYLGALAIPVFAAATTSSGENAGMLAIYTRDLLAQAVRSGGDPVIGRDAIVRRLVQVLERRGKNHPVLAGEPGVGKTAIIRALALRVAAGDVPPNLSDLRLVLLDTGALVAGAKLRGELEERVRRLLESLTSDRSARNLVLVVENVDSLLGQGAVGSGVGDLLKPALALGDLRLLGTTTPEGVRRMQDRDPMLLRRITLVPVDAPSEQQAIEIVRGIATRYETHHHVRIGERAVVACVQFAKRYIPDRALPDSAIDLLDETSARKRVEIEGIPADIDTMFRRLDGLGAQRNTLADDNDDQSELTRLRLDAEIAELQPRAVAARARLDSFRGAHAAAGSLRVQLEQAGQALLQARQDKDLIKVGELEHIAIPDLQQRLGTAEKALEQSSEGRESNLVTDQDVAATVGEWTGIPVAKMLEAETDKLMAMEDRLRHRVVGQDDALRAVSRAVRRGRVGLRDPGKPIGSFMFLGPSGVGKTELAKALAEFLFDDEAAMTRLDMSEFMERHMAQRLLGAPPGYVDSEQGGFLTEAVRRRPYSVLLFDEVEKAHQDVFNLLLQVLDDGRLTDGRGRVADFSNTVVIMTSNIGAKRILESDSAVLEQSDGKNQLRDVLLGELRGFFRPEFLNRIDDIIVFSPLTKENLGGVIDMQLVKLRKLLGDRQVSIELTAAAKGRIIELGYEPALGARPVRRAILREVQDPLAEILLSGKVGKGAIVVVDANQERFTFEVKR